MRASSSLLAIHPSRYCGLGGAGHFLPGRVAKAPEPTAERPALHRAQARPVRQLTVAPLRDNRLTSITAEGSAGTPLRGRRMS
jgi:hypothetical protein